MKLRAKIVRVYTIISLLCSWWRQQAKTFPMHQRMERELLQNHLIEGVQTPVIKGDRLWWKTKTPKRVGVGGAVKQKGIEASNIEIEVEDCEEYTATFSFYIISDSYFSYSAHGGRDFWSHFEASQLKEDATAYERRRHLRDVRAMIGAQVQTVHDNGRRHLSEKVWGPW
jgi:hypothetical protein